MNNRRKLGRFRVGREMIDDNFGPIIYAGLVPLEVRYALDHDGFEVLASGEQFNEVPEGAEAPRYDIEFDYDEVPDDRFGPFKRRVNFRARFVLRPG